jgi:hypothetical protein
MSDVNVTLLRACRFDSIQFLMNSATKQPSRNHCVGFRDASDDMYSTLIPPLNKSQVNDGYSFAVDHEEDTEQEQSSSNNLYRRYRTFDERELSSHRYHDPTEQQHESLVPLKGLDLPEVNERAIAASYESETFHNLHRQTIDRNAVHFGVRMAILLTVSSLFVIVGQGKQYPQGMWVFISVLFVSWFPSLDAASVIEKIRQRLIGTFSGAAIALAIGFPSLYILQHYGQTAQTIFLTLAIATVTFLFTFSIVQFRVGRGVKVVQKFNYASILFILTFYISVLPFCEDLKTRWLIAVYRIANVIIGCIIGALGSIVILPRSASDILQERIARQVKLAGECSEAVLHAAADAFSGVMIPIALRDEMLESPMTRRARLEQSRSRPSFRAVNKRIVDEEGDVALEKYETAIQDWKVTKSFFSILRYDPFHYLNPQEGVSQFRSEAADALARALRLQTTVVLMDGIVRNDTKHSFKEVHLTLFADIGTLIREMLTVPLDSQASDLAAEQLLEKLAETRFSIVHSCSVVGRSSNELPTLGELKRTDSGTRLSEMDSECSSGTKMPKHVKGSSVCALLFVQLVEHLALRALGLYRSWKNVDRLTGGQS